MREAPSGAVCPSATYSIQSTTVGPASYTSYTASVPGAKVGDTVAYSVDTADGIRLVPGFAILTDNQVVCTFWNPSGAPYTINFMNVYIQVLPRG